MAEEITIARPYAEAVFKLAKEKNALSSWSDMLNALIETTSVEQIRALVADPGVPTGKLAEIILEVCENKLDNEGKNLVTLLIENNRLELLPQLSALYEQLKSEYEGILEANIISAYAISDGQLEQLVSVLEKKFKCKIKAKVNIDPELIGGVKIVIGDEVIDSSVRGKLETMSVALKS
ncbi:F0F1 ATP synthase subunit delta [Nitrosomonas sp. Is37]|uniref:F0F1 ATP synthase subunit delta n=1 Tax=Nitrosomonas sp. Is37 TaxID=3080535 RepID=UPI00294B4CB9|nr:F0F1 ATP synthase subunit delta [Nitrosomonas sp. Is37]MDV6344839.1 F0F1 ATP synthase subunit delta [Nitrosomonas sp. Is37]